MVEVEKITYYLFLSLLSGTFFYFLLVVVFFILGKTVRVKIISFYGVLSSVAYSSGIVGIFLLKDSVLVYVLVMLVYFIKFVFELEMYNKIYYSQVRYLGYYFVLLLLILFSIVLFFIGVSDKIFYLILAISANVVIGIGWITTRNLAILSISNGLSIILLLLLYDYLTFSVLFSLVPYGMNSIYMIAKEYSLALKSLKNIEENIDDLINSQVDQFKNFLFLLINRMESRYDSRKNHSLNVAGISEGIARELNLEEKVVNLVREGAMMHDIGFLGIDHRKLSTNVTYEESEDIVKHVVIGKEILEKSNVFIKYLPIVLYHHEFIDGSGPEGVKGKMIPLPARIVTVADKFERLINGRDSHKLSIRKALEFIKKYSGVLYDPEVVKALERYIFKRFYY